MAINVPASRKTGKSNSHTKSKKVRSKKSNHIVYEKLLDLLERRARTRETSSLTIATIAASASLILLGIFFQIDKEVENYDYIRWLVGIIGFVFPVIGLAYKEVTDYTIQEHDFEESKKILVGKLRLPEEEHEEIVHYKRGRWIRSILFRSLAVLPALFWILIASPSHVIIASVIAFSLIVAFSLPSRRRKTS